MITIKINLLLAAYLYANVFLTGYVYDETNKPRTIKDTFLFVGIVLVLLTAALPIAIATVLASQAKDAFSNLNIKTYWRLYTGYYDDIDKEFLNRFYKLEHELIGKKKERALTFKERHDLKVCRLIITRVIRKRNEKLNRDNNRL